MKIYTKHGDAGMTTLKSATQISKADDRDALVRALDTAISYSPRVLAERAVGNLREINCAVLGDSEDADLLIVGFGGTYGHLRAAMDEMRAAGKKVAMAHFRYINPLPANTAEVLKKYPKVVVAEQNMGQLAGWLRMKVDGFCPAQYNEVKGQPFKVSELVEAFGKLINA